MRPFTIKRGDTLPVLEGVILDETGAPVDLSGCTVKIGIRKTGKTAALIDRAATIVDENAAVGDPDRGKVRCVWAVGETGTILGEGDFQGEFQVTNSAGAIGTAPGSGYIPICVLADIASPSA